MLKPFYRKSTHIFRKIVSILLLLTFGLSMGIAPAGAQILPNLPTPGQMLWLSPVFQPPVLRGMTVHPENPLLFDFIVDRGQDKINNELLRDESTKLIKYFLTSMTIPDNDAWVNLSPYEKDRIVPDALGQTEMGRQMLEQDYILKQLSASLTNPDKELGQKFWNEVRSRAQKQFGTTEILLNTFNKVWIVPDGATVVEKDGFAYITESKLKVMLDEDYVAQNANPIASTEGARQSPSIEIASSSVTPRNGIENVSTAVFREMILPQLNKELNTGKNFSATRQVYQSVILAAWYKKALKDSLLGRIYADKSKVEGVESDVQDIKQKVYDQYLEAFKKGVYNVIKEDASINSDDPIPRKYFSGGLKLGMNLNPDQLKITRGSSAVNQVAAEINTAGDEIVVVNANLAETKNEAVEISDKAASRWPAKVIPVEFRSSFKDAVRRVSGLTFIYPEDYQNPYIFSVAESLADQREFARIANLIERGDQNKVIDEIYEAFSEQTLSVINESDQRDIKSAIVYFVDAIKEYNIPQVVESENGLVFQFHRISELFESDRAYLIPIVEEFIAQEIANRPDLKNIRTVDVERMKPGSPGTSIYSVTWGGQKYIIKARPIKTFAKIGEEGAENKYLTNQIELLTKLNANGGNKHIAKLVSYGTAVDQEYLVTNYLPEQSLLLKIKSEGPQSLRNTVKIAIELAEALQFVHAQGVVYRDLAARNIQIGPDNSVYLYDFDVSSDMDYDWTADAYKLREVKSLTDFADNGQETIAENFDVQQDIANLGAVLFRTVAGEFLTNISDIRDSTIENPILRQIIERSVAPRANRYQNIAEMLRDLEALQGSLTASQDTKETDLVASSSTLSDKTIAAINSVYASVYAEIGKEFLDEEGKVSVTVTENGLFAPSSLNEVRNVFNKFKVGSASGQKFVDLGSGDGRVVIAAALRGVNAVGVEKNPQLVKIAKEALVRLARQGIKPKGSVEFIESGIEEYSLQGLNAPDFVYYFHGVSSEVNELIQAKVSQGTSNPNAILIVYGYITSEDLYSGLESITDLEYPKNYWVGAFKIPSLQTPSSASSSIGKPASDPANSIVVKVEELGVRQEILTFIHKHLSSLGEMNKDQILAILAQAPYVGRDLQGIYRNFLLKNSETANLDFVTLLTKVYKLLILNVLDNFGSIAAELATAIQNPQEREAFYEFIIKFGRDMDGSANEQIYNLIRQQPVIGKVLGESFAGVSALVPPNMVAQYFKMTLNTAAIQVDRQDFKKDGRTGFVGLTPKIEYTGDGLRKWFKPNSAALPNNIGDNFISGVTIEPSKIVSNRETAYYLWRYAQSVHGFQYVLKNLLGNDVQDTYFLIDLRSGHSLAVAAYLKTLGVDVAYQLPKVTANPKNLAVLAGLLRVPLSQAVQTSKNGIATIFDSARIVESGGYTVDLSMVPTVEDLRRRGIKRIVHINQSATGEYLNQGSGYADLRALKEQYERAGIESRFFGVDDVALYLKSSEDLFADDIHVFIHSIYGYLESGAFFGKNFFDLTSIMINNRRPVFTRWVDLSQSLSKDVDPKNSASSSVAGQEDDFDFSAAASLAELVNGEMTAIQNEAYEMATIDFVGLMKAQFDFRQVYEFATPNEIAGVFRDVKRFISLPKESLQSSQLEFATFEDRMDSFYKALQLSQLSANTNARGIKLGEYVWASLRTVAEQLNPTSKHSNNIESIASLPDAIYRDFTGRPKSELVDSLIEFYIALSDPAKLAPANQLSSGDLKFSKASSGVGELNWQQIDRALTKLAVLNEWQTENLRANSQSQSPQGLQMLYNAIIKHSQSELEAIGVKTLIVEFEGIPRLRLVDAPTELGQLLRDLKKDSLSPYIEYNPLEPLVNNEVGTGLYVAGINSVSIDTRILKNAMSGRLSALQHEINHGETERARKERNASYPYLGGLFFGKNVEPQIIPEVYRTGFSADEKARYLEQAVLELEDFQEAIVTVNQLGEDEAFRSPKTKTFYVAGYSIVKNNSLVARNFARTTRNLSAEILKILEGDPNPTLTPEMVEGTLSDGYQYAMHNVQGQKIGHIEYFYNPRISEWQAAVDLHSAGQYSEDSSRVFLVEILSSWKPGQNFVPDPQHADVIAALKLDIKSSDDIIKRALELEDKLEGILDKQKSFLSQRKTQVPDSGEKRSSSAVGLRPDGLGTPSDIASRSSVGGIDFDPTLLNLQIKRDGKGVALPLPQQDLEHININGFYPVIINIQPVNIQTLPILGFLNNPPDVALSKG